MRFIDPSEDEYYLSNEFQTDLVKAITRDDIDRVTELLSVNSTEYIKDPRRNGKLRIAVGIFIVLGILISQIKIQIRWEYFNVIAVGIATFAVYRLVYLKSNSRKGKESRDPVDQHISLDFYLNEDTILLGGVTPLGAAIIRNSIKCTEWLLKTELLQLRNRRISLSTMLSSSPELIRAGDENYFQSLVSADKKKYPGINITVNALGWTPLFMACYEGRIDILRMMLSLNVEDKRESDFYVDVNERNKSPDLRFPIQAAVTQRRLPILRILLENNANPDSCNINGQTALLIASEYGFSELCELLIEYDADLNFRNTKSGNTCLKLITLNGKNDRELALNFVKQGAIVAIADNSEKTCVDYALSKGALPVLSGIKEGLVYRRMLFLSLYRNSIKRISSKPEQKEIFDYLFHHQLWDKQLLSLILDYEFPLNTLKFIK